MQVSACSVSLLEWYRDHQEVKGHRFDSHSGKWANYKIEKEINHFSCIFHFRAAAKVTYQLYRWTNNSSILTGKLQNWRSVSVWRYRTSNFIQDSTLWHSACWERSEWMISCPVLSCCLKGSFRRYDRLFCISSPFFSRWEILQHITALQDKHHCYFPSICSLVAIFREADRVTH